MGGVSAGDLPVSSGDSAQSQAICRRSIRISEFLGEQPCPSDALWVLGFDTWLRGDRESASRWARTGLETQRSFHDTAGAALIIEWESWGTYHELDDLNVVAEGIHHGRMIEPMIRFQA